MRSIYPRECHECKRVYANKSSFSNHITSGKCGRTQAKQINTNNIQQNNTHNNIQNVNTIHHNNVQQNNVQQNNNIITINVQGAGLTNEEIKQRIDAILNTQGLLELKKLFYEQGTAEDVMKHVGKNTSTLKEIQETMSVHTDLLREKLLQIINDTSDKPPSYPLQLLFQRIFLHISQGGEITLKDLKRRVMKTSDSGCEILTKNEKIPNWTRRHWDTLIGELLYFLGTRLIEASLPDMGLEEASKEEIKGGLLESSHPFYKWWGSIEQYEDIQFDTHGKQLIKIIADKIAKDCKDDLIQGWHKLIECCSVLYTSPAQLGAQNAQDEKKCDKKAQQLVERIDSNAASPLEQSKSLAVQINSDL